MYFDMLPEGGQKFGTELLKRQQTAETGLTQ